MEGLFKMVTLVAALVLYSLSFGGKRVGAQMLGHVVGGDRGWDPSSDINSWSSGRIFRVGEKIWFAYSAAHGSVVELETKKEYEACDVSNPIRMYTDGIDSVSLKEEGIRYFASSKEETCKKGLKLHVKVLPYGESDVADAETSEVLLADSPSSPSSSNSLTAVSQLILVGFLASLLGF